MEPNNIHVFIIHNFNVGYFFSSTHFIQNSSYKIHHSQFLNTFHCTDFQNIIFLEFNYFHFQRCFVAFKTLVPSFAHSPSGSNVKLLFNTCTTDFFEISKAPFKFRLQTCHKICDILMSNTSISSRSFSQLGKCKRSLSKSFFDSSFLQKQLNPDTKLQMSFWSP